MGDFLKVGIVGFGRIGAEHAGWIARCEGARVAAVYDPTQARRDLARERGLSVVGSVTELLAHADAVLVSTPTSMHFDDVMLALVAGKHVMVEKPMSLTLAEAEQMRDAASQAGRVLSVFHCRRWDADFLAVRQLVASGTLGRVFNIESRLGQWASCVGPAAKEYRPGWRNEAAFGGGGLYDWGSHFLDQLQLLLLPAKPVRVFAQLRGNVWTSDCDDLARVLIDFSDGTSALCEINTTTTHPLPRWHLDGTLGSASAPHSPAFDTKQWAQLEVRLASGQVESLPPPPVGLSESDLWTRFADACRGSGVPAVTVESVLPTTALIDAAIASGRLGRSVELSVVGTVPIGGSDQK